MRNIVKLVRDLQRRKARERRGCVVAEGRRLVEDALESGCRVTAVLAAEDVAQAAAASALALAAERGIDTGIVPRRDFDALADTETPSGLLAVVQWAPLKLEALPRPGPGAVALVLDGVQDPGNVGAMLRTAHGLGAWCTVALDGTADVRNSKAVRAAMGAHFRHPVAEAAWEDFTAYAEAQKLSICLAVQDGERVDTAARKKRMALVIGSEGHGVRRAWEQERHCRLTIPMCVGAESLNAAVAAGILLYELLREPA